MGLLLITHDLDVASDMADRVAVMYGGQIVEWAARDQLYGSPRHPYTQKLFAVLPRLDRRGQRLDSLPGRVPSPDAVITSYSIHYTKLYDVQLPPGASLAPPSCNEGRPPDNVLQIGSRGQLINKEQC